MRHLKKIDYYLDNNTSKIYIEEAYKELESLEDLILNFKILPGLIEIKAWLAILLGDESSSNQYLRDFDYAIYKLSQTNGIKTQINAGICVLKDRRFACMETFLRKGMTYNTNGTISEVLKYYLEDDSFLLNLEIQIRLLIRFEGVKREDAIRRLKISELI